MSAVTTATSWTVVPPPTKYRQVSACPKCGAPIYVDAELGADVLDALPTPWFTCLCRLTVSYINTTIPNTVPGNPINPPGPTWDGTVVVHATGPQPSGGTLV